MRRRASLAALAALLAGAASRRAAAGVQVESLVQESVFNQAELESPNLAVGASSQRLLIVALATGNLAAETQQVRWNGVPLTRFESRTLVVPEGPCRLELWMLMDPPAGIGPLLITLSTAAGFGFGAVVYSGVDRQEPFGPLQWSTGSGGRISVELSAPGERPVLGAACLGGAWKTGPTLTTPEAVPATAGADELWNFTEPAIVGLGSHQVASNGVARVSWEVTGSEPYQWMAMGVSIKPDGEILPDAGPDSGLDAGADGGSDAAPDRAMTIDGTPVTPSQEDGGAETGGMADVHLRVGCACDTGRARPTGAVLPLLFLLVWAHRRKAR